MTRPIPFLGLLLWLLTLSTASAQSSELVTVEVNWFDELIKGGMTSIALVALLMAGITFAIERLLSSRSRYITPDGLANEVAPLLRSGEFAKAKQACEAQPSTLGRMLEFAIGHRDTDPGLLIPSAQDIGARELKRHLQKTYALAVVAALAPLLGLLGTMIGMIESFKLVEIYGDDGGASMLAGSISKALITTAVGLIIAIGALAVYHFLKGRINSAGNELEEDFERLTHSWLLDAADSGIVKTEDEA